MKKESIENKGGICVETAGVKKKLLPSFIQEKTEKIEITGIAVNNLCHTNSKFFSC